MTRLKLTIDPMPTKRAEAIEAVNARFHAMSNSHRDHAHAHKRFMALSFLAGEPAADLLIGEAKLRGVTTKALAQTIVSKPNEVARRELKRQELLLKIEAATTLEELEEIKAETPKIATF